MENERDAKEREIFREIHATLARWADGGPSEVDAAELESMLRRSELAREVYLDYIQDTVLLGTLANRPGDSGPLAVSELFVTDLIEDFVAEQELQRAAAEAALLKEKERLERLGNQPKNTTRKDPPSPHHVVTWSMIAAGLALVLWLALGRGDRVAPQVRLPDVPMPPAKVATISSRIGSDTLAYHATDSEVSVSSDIGTRLTVGKYSLPSGFLELLFDSGPTTVIQGPAEFELWAKNGLELGVGKAVAKVPHSAEGFVVNTTTASIIDLGTEFGVATDLDGSTEVLVLDGKVSLKPRPLPVESPQSDGPLGEGGPVAPGRVPYATLLTAGAARLVDADRVVKVIENPNRSKFLRSLDGLIAVDDFKETERNNPLRGGIGFEDDWKLERGKIDFQDGKVRFSDKGDARMDRSFPPIDVRSNPVYFSAEFQVSGDDPVCSCWLALTTDGRGDRGAVIGLTDGRFAARLTIADFQSEELDKSGDFGAFVPGRWHFLVGRLEANVAGNLDRLSIWVDPSADMLGDPQQVVEGDLGFTSIDTLSVLFWDFGDAGNSLGAVDNVRVGTSRAAVQ